MKVAAPILCAGAFGAVAPNLVGMAQQALRGQPDLGAGYLYAQPGFWVGTLVLAVLGLGIVLFYEETSPKRAVALGAAAPALILGWAQGTGGSASEQARASDPARFPALMAVAAAPGVAPSPLQGDTVWVVVSGLTPADTAADLVAVLGAPAARPARVVLRLVVPAQPVPLPDGAREVYVTIRGASSNRLAVPGHGTLQLRLSYSDGAFWKGFRRAFGVRSTAGAQPRIEVVS